MEKIINLKNKIVSFLKNEETLIKQNKKLLITIVPVLILILVIVIALKFTNKNGSVSSNLLNLGFSVNEGSTTYYLGYKDGNTDGIYKINSKGKEKISEDYGYYLNKCGNYIYYIDSQDNSIVKMKTNGKDKEIIVEDVDLDLMTVKDDYIYYFDNSYFYRVKTNGQNKKRISNKTIQNYQIIGNTIYYSYVDNGNYTIAKMKTDGEENSKINTQCGMNFFVTGNEIYYIYENKQNNETKYELYKMKTNGKNKKRITQINDNIDLSTVNFTKKAIFYAKRNQEGELGIYKINLNGKKEQKIAEINGNTTKININNNYIYYPDINDDGDVQLFRIKINKKGKVEKL